jgi:thiaminase
LYSKLKAACANEWKEYVHHKFVQQMQDGTLPIDCFQHYIKQDYLFLLHFARANAISCYKTEKPEMMMEATQIVGEILGVEKSLHQKVT